MVQVEEESKAAHSSDGVMERVSPGGSAGHARPLTATNVYEIDDLEDKGAAALSHGAYQSLGSTTSFRTAHIIPASS